MLGRRRGLLSRLATVALGCIIVTLLVSPVSGATTKSRTIKAKVTRHVMWHLPPAMRSDVVGRLGTPTAHLRGFGAFDIGPAKLGSANRSRGNWVAASRAGKVLVRRPLASRGRSLARAAGRAPELGSLRLVPALRTRYSNTFVSSSGLYVARVYSGPINYQTATGQFKPIDDKLQRVAAGFVARADADHLRFPLRSNGTVSIRQGGATVRVRFLGASASAKASVTGSIARYRDAYPGGNVSLQAVPGSLEFAFRLANRYAHRTFAARLMLGRGASARLQHNIVQVLGRNHRVIFRVSIPAVLEQAGHGLTASPQGSSTIHVSLHRNRNAYVLRYALDRRWLTAPGRRFPVVLDPTVLSPSPVAGSNDCTVFNGSPTSTAWCGGSPTTTYDYVGSQAGGTPGTYQTLMNFPSDPGGIPADSQVVGATLTMDVQTLSAGPVSYQVRPLTDTFDQTQTASWNNSSTGTVWTCPGGDYVGCQTGSSSAPIDGYGTFAATGNSTVSLTPLVQSWVDGSYTGAQATPALMLQATSTWTGYAGIYRVGSSNAPTLTIDYVPRLGADPGSTVPLTSLDSTTSLGLNVANGNVQLTQADMNVGGIAGMDVGLSHSYNVGQTNNGWTLDQPDSLNSSYAGDTADITGSDGNMSVWNRAPQPSGSDAATIYTPPAGSTGTLCQAAMGVWPSATLTNVTTTTGGAGTFYVNGNGQVALIPSYSGTPEVLGGSVAPNSSLSTYYYQSTQSQGAFYVTAGGGLAQWASNFSNPSQPWSNNITVSPSGSVAPNTSPSTILVSGAAYVFYVNANMGISEAYWTGSAWTTVVLTSNNLVAPNTSVATGALGGGTSVWYVNASHKLDYLQQISGVWTVETALESGVTIAANSSPTVFDDSSANPYVFYHDSNNQLSGWHFNSGWSSYGSLSGGSIAANTSPSGYSTPSYSSIYYTNTSDQISMWVLTGSTWTDDSLGGATVEPYTSPSAVAVPPGSGNYSNDQYISYVAANGGIGTYYWDNLLSAWYNSTGSAAQSASTPSCAPKNSSATWQLTAYGSGGIEDFNSAGQLISAYDRNGNQITYTPGTYGVSSITDTEGRTFTYNYTSGNLTSITDNAGSRTLQFGWTSGQLTSFTDAASRTTHYSYYTSGAFTGELYQITDPNGNVTTLSYATTPSAAKSAQYEVDITRAAPVTGGSTLTTQYLFYSYAITQGRVPAGYPTCGTDGGTEVPFGDTIVVKPTGNWSMACYDAHDRVYQAIDEYGNRTTTSFNANDQVTAAASPLGDVTYSGYDACFRQTSQRQGVSGPMSTTAYASGIASDGSCAATTPRQYEASSSANPAGTGGGSLSTAYFYDGNGNLTRENESNGNNLRFTYLNGQMASSTAANGTPYAPGSTGYTGNTTTYTYAYTGQILHTLTVQPPSPLAATVYTYDSDGRVTSVKDGNNNTTSTTYTGDDEAHVLTFQDASTITNTIDSDGNLTSAVDTASTGGGTTSYSFDHDNRLTSETDPGVGGQPATTVSYAYNGNGDLCWILTGSSTNTCTSPPTGAVSYSYDNDDRVTTAQEPSVSSPIKFSYDTDSRLTCTLYPNAVAVQNTYDSYSELTSIQSATGSGTNAGCNKASTTGTPYGTPDTSYGYTYGTSSNQTGLVQTETINGTQNTFYYDNLNRLAEDTTGDGTSIYNYAYDPNGNLLSRTDPITPANTLEMVYNGANELCAASETLSVSCSSPTYTYDGAGNLTSQGTGGTSFAYNDRLQTTGITPNGSSQQTLSYRGTGQTNLTQVGTQPTGGTAPVLENSVLGVIAEESGANSGGTSTTTYFTRAPNGTLLGERTPTANYYYIQDSQGSVVALTNSSGAVANTYSYDPYGMTATTTGTAPNPFGFDGGFQAPGGLYHFGARIYNPVTGNWTQPDPAAQSLATDPTQADSYSFAGDDPTNSVDLTGLAEWDRLFSGEAPPAAEADEYGYSGSVGGEEIAGTEEEASQTVFGKLKYYKASVTWNLKNKIAQMINNASGTAWAHAEPGMMTSSSVKGMAVKVALEVLRTLAKIHGLP